VSRARKVRVAALGAAAVMALAGCGLTPGAAAVVGDETITTAELDDAAQALCAANIAGAEARGQSSPVLASRGARQGALQVLIESELTHQFAASRGVEPDQQQVSQAVEANQSALAMIPKSEREQFVELLRGFAEGQVMLLEIGRNALAEQGNEDPTEQEATAEGLRLRQQWAEQHSDVEVAPKYGAYEDGALRPGSGSLSIPVSERARAGAVADPPSGWVSELPASQTCR
jgi:hypothetical protein